MVTVKEGKFVENTKRVFERRMAYYLGTVLFSLDSFYVSGNRRKKYKNLHI